MNAGHSEHHFWSPILGAAAVRISMADDAGLEYFMIIPDEDGGAPYRLARDRAISAISTAIAEGDDPGEVSA